MPTLGGDLQGGPRVLLLPDITRGVRELLQPRRHRVRQSSARDEGQRHPYPGQSLMALVRVVQHAQRIALEFGDRVGHVRVIEYLAAERDELAERQHAVIR